MVVGGGGNRAANALSAERWEYRTLDQREIIMGLTEGYGSTPDEISNAILAEFNHLGAEGWEYATGIDSAALFLFKRRLP